jgi:hypothetical protein
MPRVLVTFVPDQPGLRAEAASILRGQCPELLDVATGPSDLPGHTQVTLVLPDASPDGLVRIALDRVAPDLPVMAFQVAEWPQPTPTAFGLGRC